MKRILILLLLAACQRETQPPLTAALLSIGAVSSTARNVAVETLTDMATLIDARIKAGTTPADAMNAVIFDDLKFQREVQSTDPRYMRLPVVLADRRGSCLGLAALYLALGERLGPAHGFTVDGIMAPGHFFVRIGTRNIELLRRGEQMPDAWYRERYEIPENHSPSYLRPLTPTEVMAVYDYNIGNDLRLQGRFVEAAIAYRRASAAFPQMAEPLASLGLVRHLSGALKEAEKAYLAAQKVNPQLPGLERNLAVIREEMGKARR